jgi:probable F420-dependent oxidoreductase
MKLGMNLRNWGDQAHRSAIVACAKAADESGLHSIWVNDHIGFPPKLEENDFEIPDDFGSILDPLAALAFLAACTERVKLGTAVLLLPYRPSLLTAKWIASLQALSEDRILLGVGAGWMVEEFRALGVDRSRRGALTDEGLDFLQRCFDQDVIESNGQPLRFAPRPNRPPFLIGGVPKVAIPRAAARGDGWMPVGIAPAELKGHIEHLNEQARASGRGPMEVFAMKTLPLDKPDEAVALAQAYRDAGATELVHTQGVSGPDEYRRIVEFLESRVMPAVG